MDLLVLGVVFREVLLVCAAELLARLAPGARSGKTGKCSQERLTRGTVTSTMRRAAHPSGCAKCGAGAGCSVIKYQYLESRILGFGRYLLVFGVVLRKVLLVGAGELLARLAPREGREREGRAVSRPDLISSR